MVELKQLITPRVGKDMEQFELWYTVNGNVKCHNYVVKQFSNLKKKTTSCFLYLSCDIAIPFLSIHPRELKVYSYTKTWTQVFTSASVVITKTWKEPFWILIGE